MEWPILTAIAAFAVAAIIVGALFLKVGEPLNYVPQCSDCQFFVKGPASLVQTEGAAYLIRGTMLTPSSILAEYGWAYDGAGRPLKPGQSIYCEKGIFVRVVGGIAQASCDEFLAPIQSAYSGYTPISSLPPIIICSTSATFTLLPYETKMVTLCFQNSINFSGRYYFEPCFRCGLNLWFKDKTGNTVFVVIEYWYWAWWGIRGPFEVRVYENDRYLGGIGDLLPPERNLPQIIVTSNAVVVTGYDRQGRFISKTYPLPTPLAKDYLNVTITHNYVFTRVTVNLVSS